MFWKTLTQKQKFNLKNLNGILKNRLALRLNGKMNLNVILNQSRDFKILLFVLIILLKKTFVKDSGN